MQERIINVKLFKMPIFDGNNKDDTSSDIKNVLLFSFHYGVSLGSLSASNAVYYTMFIIKFLQTKFLSIIIFNGFDIVFNIYNKFH